MQANNINTIDNTRQPARVVYLNTSRYDTETALSQAKKRFQSAFNGSEPGIIRLYPPDCNGAGPEWIEITPKELGNDNQ